MGKVIFAQFRSFIVASFALFFLVLLLIQTKEKQEYGRMIEEASQSQMPGKFKKGLEDEMNSKGLNWPFFYIYFDNKSAHQSINWAGTKCFFHKRFFSFGDSLGQQFGGGTTSVFDQFKRSLVFSMWIGFVVLAFSNLLAFIALLIKIWSPDFLYKAIKYFAYACHLMPGFIICAIAVVFLCGDKYGVFPPVGSININDDIGLVSHYLILPLLCLILPLSSWMLVHYDRFILIENAKPYRKGLLAKGLNNRQILKTHTLFNVSPQIWQANIQVIPHILLGLIVVESTFGLFGLGSLFVKGYQLQEWGAVWLAIQWILVFIMVAKISYIVFIHFFHKGFDLER